MVRVNDRRRDREPTAMEMAEEIASYARQQALLDEAARFGAEHGWAVHHEIRGSSLSSLVFVRTEPNPRLVFVECVPDIPDADWRTWLDTLAALEAVGEASQGAVQVVVVTPAEWQLVTDALA